MKIEKLKEKHAKEIREAKLEASVLKAIPRSKLKPSSVYVHDDHVSVSYEKGYADPYTLDEAIAIMKRWEPFIIKAEHWRDSCIMVRPSKLIDKRDKKNAKLEFESYAQIKVERGGKYNERGDVETTYSHQTLTFWAEIKGGLRGSNTIIDVEIKTRIPKVGGADLDRKWWRSEPSSSRSHYWGDSISFDAWVGHEVEEE